MGAIGDDTHHFSTPTGEGDDDIVTHALHRVEEQTAAMSEAEIANRLQQVPTGEVTETEGGKRLERHYAVDDFAHALAFANAIGALAEAEFHHPRLVVE